MATKKKTTKKRKKGLKGPASIITVDGAKNAATQTANYTKDNTQTLLILAGLSIGIYVVYKAFKGVSNVSDKVGDILDSTDPTKGDQLPDGNTLPGHTGVTITQNQAKNIATGLYQAMADPGTDEQAIFNLLKGKTPQDFTLISNEFGLVRYLYGADGGFIGPKRNLAYWLTEELNVSEMVKLKQIMPGVF